jgi:hypothetical protein
VLSGFVGVMGNLGCIELIKKKWNEKKKKKEVKF